MFHRQMRMTLTGQLFVGAAFALLLLTADSLSDVIDRNSVMLIIFTLASIFSMLYTAYVWQAKRELNWNLVIFATMCIITSLVGFAVI